MKEDFSFLAPELMKVFKNAKTVDCYIKDIAGLVKLESGAYFIFRKFPIETRFCFGYGQNGISTEDDFKSACEAARKAKKRYIFIEVNLAEFDKAYCLRDEDYYTSPDYRETSAFVHVYSESYLRQFEFYRDFCTYKMTERDRKLIREEYEIQRAKFQKRLETYWKKYQDTKLLTWTYLMD